MLRGPDPCVMLRIAYNLIDSLQCQLIVLIGCTGKLELTPSRYRLVTSDIVLLFKPWCLSTMDVIAQQQLQEHSVLKCVIWECVVSLGFTKKIMYNVNV